MYVIHLRAGNSTACSSFRPAAGRTAYDLTTYRNVLMGDTVHDERACKTCYPHYVRRMQAVNRKRVAAGRAPLAVEPVI